MHRLLSLYVLIFIGVFSYGQDSLISVKAEQGDGIYSILRKQGLNPATYLEEFVRLNQDSIENGTQLVQGRTYLIPYAPDATSNMGTEVALGSGAKYPIFGGNQAFVKPKSDRLDDTVYYLISGHGGPDPGAMEDYNGTLIAEDEYAYDVTLRLARELLAHGAKVYVIVRDKDDGIRDERTLEMDKDEVVYPNDEIPLDQLERLKQRVDIVNKLYLQNSGKYQRLIVTHIDSRSEDENIDVFFYHHAKSENGKRLAESIHTTFRTKYEKFQPNRDYSGTFTDRSSLYMVKNTLPAMAYIEIGNIKNGRDKRRILDPDNRQALAKWISEGALLDYESR